MDKELLAVIGKLYLENINLYNTVDYLQKQNAQLASNQNDQTVTTDKE